MRRQKGVRAAVASLLGSSALVLAHPTPAFATDTTAPALTVQPALFFPGGQIGPSSPASAQNESVYTWQIPMYITWTGSDASDICGYDVQEQPAGDFPYTVVTRTLRTRFDDDTTDYDGSFGGGSQVVDSWIVIAHDCAGNATTRSVGVSPVRVTQEDGTDESGVPGGVTVGYSGTWATANCTCWSHGTVRKTTQQGASATIGFSTSGANHPIALVMEKAPGRGKFTVYLDGVNKGTIDTYAAVATHRVIVWSSKAATAGSHVVKIVNQATAGRTRIDLDAVLTNY